MTMVALGLFSARGIIAVLGYHDVFGLTTFAINMVVTMAIAAATDYAIFLIGRYHEARRAGEDRERAYYTMFRGTAHVVLASGSGRLPGPACACTSPAFRTSRRWACHCRSA